MSRPEPLFSLKQTTERCIIKEGTYSYIAECQITKNGKRQIWRYETYCDELKNCSTTYKKLKDILYG
jgi:hypothetical protein